jgi:hypothetical protein
VPTIAFTPDLQSILNAELMSINVVKAPTKQVKHFLSGWFILRNSTGLIKPFTGKNWFRGGAGQKRKL